MAKTSIWQIKEEIVVFLRNQDIISVADRGVTTSTDTGTFTNAGNYTLTTNPTLLKNVRSVTVATQPLSFGADYWVDYKIGKIYFTTPQTGAYSIVYDQGSTDRIFPDFPQTHLKLKDFPRIAVDMISGTTTEFELGAGSNWTEYLITVVCYTPDQQEVEEMITGVRSSIMDNKKKFFYTPFITPSATGPILVAPFGDSNKIFQRNQDCRILFVYEDDQGGN